MRSQSRRAGIASREQLGCEPGEGEECHDGILPGMLDSQFMILPTFDLLCEMGPCLVVRKPAGLLTQAPPGIDSLEARIKAWIKQRDQKPGNVYLGVPHRLDRPVSGAMIFARHARAARRLSEQFEGRLVRKIYWACVTGVVEPDEGTWVDHVRKVPGEPRAELVPADHAEGRRAVLHYKVKSRADWGTWLEIELETGRTHQVRIQASARGHAVLGDTLYGSTVPFGVLHEDERLRAIALHGRSITFRHPMTQEMVSIEATVTDEWPAEVLAVQTAAADGPSQSDPVSSA
jgi:23S rRNA pseudouridine1911/1915/1917 synthase